MIRLLWGIFGTPHARYADFVPTIPQFLDYARRLLRGSEPRYVGHNPAGALMMALLILSVATCGVSGWMMSLDRFWGEIWVESIHETSADVILVAAVLHVLGAIFESVRHRENLPLAMITGRKRRASGTDVCHAPAADRR